MKFELLPVIDIMMNFYEKPMSERFPEYLKMLQGDTKGDLVTPLSGFNPMAKEYVKQKLLKLKELEAEEIIQKTLLESNNLLSDQNKECVFKVALNLCDDLKGGWTNRYTTDYDSKFRINALVNRKFCTPVFWSSEEFTTQLITERTLEYVFRSAYQLTNPKPNTLKEHIEQEKFLAKKIGSKNLKQETNYIDSDLFYKKYQDSSSFHIIFNFFYGDNVSKSLEFPVFGIREPMAGFEYAKQLAQ